MRRTHLTSHFDVGEALPDYVRGNMLETKSIVSQFPQVVAEHLFVQITKQVERLDADISALQLALEQAPKVFESIGVNLSVNVLFRMVDNLMLEPLMLESFIGHERVGIDRTTGPNVTANLGLYDVLAASRDDGSANFAAALQNSHDGGLIFDSTGGGDSPFVLVPVHESGSATNESFVRFDLSTAPTEFGTGIVLHGEANPVEHEPRGFLSNAKSASYFVGTHTVLAVRNHPHGDEPLIEGQSGILKDGANLHAELFLGVFLFAFPHPASGDKTHVSPATSGAGNAIGPSPRNHELETVVGVGEINDGLLEGLWFGAHGVLQ
jgi:hypothetical protein